MLIFWKFMVFVNRWCAAGCGEQTSSMLFLPKHPSSSCRLGSFWVFFWNKRCMFVLVGLLMGANFELCDILQRMRIKYCLHVRSPCSFWMGIQNIRLERGGLHAKGRIVYLALILCYNSSQVLQAARLRTDVYIVWYTMMDTYL
ncbi:hypothetical protein VPH35_094935 [Triticum aestivum]|uniref:Uncharacterized protein n=1 Tax=Aegilops tauschii subsp. strangulata TaxID=200361 RepID=A0A453JGD2_AEGTS